MDMEVAIRVGCLSVPPQNFLRKSWLKKYCALYDASNHGIQRIELFESEDACVKQNPTKIVPLTDCWKVTPLPQKHQPNVFEVRTKSNSYQFSADTFQDMSNWLTSLQAVAFSKNQPKSLPPTLTTHEEKQEDNLLYCSMDEPEVYAVKAVPTDAILRNNLKGDYRLIITTVNFSIAEESSQGRIGKVILTWPFRHIRRYGCSTENFSFEAGRKCSSGEGLFTFATTDGLKIFHSIDGHVSILKSTQGEGDIPNSPSIKEDKSNCFTAKDSLISNELMSFSKTSGQSFPVTFTIDNDVLLNQKSNLKSLPPFRKPPRKTKPHVYDQCSDSVNKNSTSPDSNQYAEIRRRSSSDISNRNLEIFPSQSSQTNVYSVSNISHIPDKDDLSSYTETLRIHDIPRKDVKVKRASFALDYENCGPSFESTLQSSRPFSNEHVYGKLTNARQSVPPTTDNVYGSILAHSIAGTSPVYCNLPYSKQTLGENSKETECNPEHFMKNDAEYAQVLKKNKNSL